MTVNYENQSRNSLFKDVNLYVIFLVTLIAIMGVSSITPAFPLISQKLGISTKQIGLLITVFTLPGVALTLVLGVLADHLGRKRIIVPALFLFAFSGAACGLVRDFEILLLFRFFQGIGAAPLGALNITMIGDLYDGIRRNTAMGYNASVLSIGTAIYPVIGGALAASAWYFPFFLPLLALPVGFAVLFILKNPEPAPQPHFIQYLKTIWTYVKNKHMVCLLAANLSLFVILYGVYLNYIPFLIKDRFEGTSLEIGLIMSLMSLTTAMVSSQMGRISVRIAERHLLKAGFFLYGCALMAFIWVSSFTLIPVPIVIFGLGHGILIPSIQTMMSRTAPLQYRAGVLSLNGMILRLGQTIGPLVMSLVFSVFYIKGVLYGGAMFAFIIFALCVYIWR